jgi:asparagine synthase (glutamine-hydrolysing)
MCGINGIFGLENLEDPNSTIQAMNDCLAHRGPDAEGIYTDDWVALGHRRLSIIDTSAAGNQPFYSEDRNLVLVFNGEIYNYIELKAELNDVKFQTGSDTEVLLAAYQKWGIECLQKLNGMFAFALWDKVAHQLFVVRDRMGIKPLYIASRGKRLIFSSEIRALLKSGLVERKLDEDGLIDYLRYQTVHAPKTLISGVEMVLPGHYLRISDNEIEAVRYYDLSAAQPVEENLKSIQKEVFNRLQKSVEIRMRADVPFGAFLSGGIDSSAIVGLMASVSDHPIRTFSVVFEEDEWSEAPYSQMIAKKFNTQHTEIPLSVEDFKSYLPEALAAMDHPSGDGPNTFVVSKVTKEAGITMALSGLGGDELFAGYDVFKRMLSLQSKRWVMSFPRGVRTAGTGLLKLIKPGVSSDKIAEILRKDYLDFEYVYPVNRQVLLDAQVVKLTSRKTLPKNSVQVLVGDLLQHGKPGFDLPWLSKVSVAEINSYMQNVLLRDSDQMSMAHALEVRVPFLDHNLAEYVLGVNDNMKYPHSPKRLLVESMGNLLPEEIVNRPKMGFTLPWELWMKGDLKSFCEEHLERLAERRYFDKRELLGLWQKFLRGKVSWSRLWPLVVLEHWMHTQDVD